MNILIIGPYPPPFGGISSLVKSLVEGFKQKDIDEVVILYFGSSNEIRKVDGALVYERSVIKNAWRIFLPSNWSLIPTLLSIYSGNKLSIKDYVQILIKSILTIDLAKKHKINVSSFYQSDTSLHLLLCKKIWNKKISINLNVFGEIYDVSDYLHPKKNILLEMLYESDAVVSSSCYCADSFKTIGNERKIDVIYVGVSLSRFSDGDLLREDYRKSLGINDETTVLLFMGRFNKEMGLHAILEMMPSLEESRKDFHVILAGAKGELVESAFKSQRNYPDMLTIMNDIPFDLQPTLYAAADIVLTPSRDKHACMGVSIKEAMAASVPVIASDSGGITEAVVDNETGVIVPLLENGENDTEKYLQAILSLSKDPERMDLFAKNSRRIAEDKFSEVVTIEKTFSVFKKHAPS